MTEYDLDIFIRFVVALAIGMMIGLERGWSVRGEAVGHRLAGIRTFTLVSILGAAAGLIALELGAWVLGSGFVGLSLLIAVAHYQEAQRDGDIGITTEVGLLLTFCLGALAMFGHLTVAAAAGVVSAILLGLKPQLHLLIERISREELFAIFRLLLISVVILPVLPDQGYGPYEALNPFRIWLMVVFIAGLSFVGYVAIRLLGANRGTLLMGFMGGLASSTAVTISLSRLAGERRDAGNVPAAGILAASAVMFGRSWVVSRAVSPRLAGELLWPVAAAAGIAIAAAAVFSWLGRRETRQEPTEESLPGNPLELKTAIQFAVLLAVVLVLTRAVTDWLGETGLYGLAVLSSLADVDAFMLSLGTMMRGDEIVLEVASVAALIAIAVNTAVKPALAALVAGPGLAVRLAVPLALAVVAAALLLVLTGKT